MAKVIKPLVVQQIKNATVKDSPLRDGEGLYLKITERTKIWRFDYYKPYTKKRTSIRLGEWPEMSLLEARGKRAEYKALLLQNIDPQDAIAEQQLKQREEQYNTFQTVAERWKNDFKSKMVMSDTMFEDWRRLENHIFPFIGDLPIHEINSKRLITTVQPMYEKGHTNALEKTLRIVVSIMDYAENIGLIEIHNCNKAQKAFHFRPAKRNPTIKPSLLPKLIADIQAANIQIKTKYLIFWSLVTGVRPAEVVSVEWTEIDWQKKLWIIPKEKMKGRKAEKRPHSVPLSNLALDILDKMKMFSGKSRFVFPHFCDPNKSMSSATVNMALKRNGYKDILTSHGIRSIIRTYLAEIGIEKNTAESVLAHKIKDDLEYTYNRHDYLEQRIPVMQLWSNYIIECGLNLDSLINIKTTISK